MGRLPLPRVPRGTRCRPPEPERTAARTVLSRAGRGAARARSRSLRARRRDRRRRRRGARLHRAPRAAPSRRVARRATPLRDAVAADRVRRARSRRRRPPVAALRGTPPRARGAARAGAATALRDAGDGRPGGGETMARPVPGQRHRRIGGEPPPPPLRARPPQHAQGEARAHRRLRPRRVQDARRPAATELAAARPLRRRRRAAPRRHHLRLQRGAPGRAARRAAAARHAPRRASLGTRFPARGQPERAASGRGWPLGTRLDGAGLDPRFAGARLRGRLRPARRPPLPPSRALPPLAPRSRPGVVHARPAPGSCGGPGRAAAVNRTVDVDGRKLALTNLDKVLWPQTGTTKAELIEYYVAVAPALLPHLEGRPLTLRRFPDGVDGITWHQNEIQREPDWFPVFETTGREGRRLRFATVDGLAALVWLANQAAIELHPFSWRIDRPREPTQLVFDLDPGAPAGLVEAARVALALRPLLEELRLDPRGKKAGSLRTH